MRMNSSDKISSNSQHNFLPYIDNQNQESKISPTVAKQIAKSEKKLLTKDDELLFSSVTNTRWIVSDHMRLHAIDGLLTRILDYHNNIHQRVIYNKALISSTNIKSTENVAYYISTSSLRSSYGEHFQIIKQIDISLNLIKIKENLQSKGLHWIHLLDLCVLNEIIIEFNLDPLCVASFIDMRYHSCLLPTMNGCFISLCYYQMDESSLQVHLFKLFFYAAANGLVITFVSELMPDVKGQQFVSINKLKDTAAVARDSEGNMSYIMEDNVSSSIDIVCNLVIDRWETSIKSIAKYELGPIFIFYELASEILKVQDPVIEFLSRTIFFFKTKTSFRLTYRRKIQYMRRAHIVLQALLTLESNTKDIQQIILELKQITEGNHQLQHPISELVTSKAGISGIYDLYNNYSFMYSTIQCKLQELRIVNDAMITISDVRADNTALVLSLIATIFLPATFLTGVFGMNFTENGGYTIELVNNKYGPLVFGLSCLGIAVFFGLYYLYLGWIEPSYSVRVAFKFLFGKKMMNYFLGYDIEEDDFSITPITDTAASNQSIASLPTYSSSNNDEKGNLEIDKNPVNASSKDSSMIKNPLAGHHPKTSMESVVSSSTIISNKSRISVVERGSIIDPQQYNVSNSTKNRVIDALEEDNYRRNEAKNMRQVMQQMGTNQIRVLPSTYRS